MLHSIDQLRRSINLESYPTKIISVVPSQTELLYDLGLDKSVHGITKFCIHPPQWLKEKAIIGGTKNLNIDKINTINPDLIIANKEENNEEQIRALSENYPVWISDIKNLNEAVEMILAIGRITNKLINANEIVKTIRTKFTSLTSSVNENQQKSVAYLIWRDPYLSVGKDTFIHEMLSSCGLINVFSNEKRYPELSPEKLKDASPELIFLSSEPYPFTEKHIDEFNKLSPGSRVIPVNGEMFSWYGSRLRLAPDYFTSLLKKIDSPS